MKKVFFVLALFALVSCNGYKNVSVDEFQQMMKDDPTAQVVDVRTPAEYAEGHLIGAVNIDWHDSDFPQTVEAQLDKTRPVLVYCRSGRRSAAAAAWLDGNDYKTYNLRGGYQAWSNAGKKIDHSLDVPYKTASGYFFRNDAVIDIKPHKITSEDQLLNYFGMAATMGENGMPTTIDFNKSFVIPIVLPSTDKDTHIVIRSLLRTGDKQLRLAFHVERGNESRSYTIIPCELLIVDGSYRDYDILITSPEKY